MPYRLADTNGDSNDSTYYHLYQYNGQYPYHINQSLQMNCLNNKSKPVSNEQQHIVYIHEMIKYQINVFVWGK